MKIIVNQFSHSVAVLLIIFIGCRADFGYNGEKGPDHWNEKYENCVGKHQSPINIDTHNVTIAHFPPLVFKNINKKLINSKITNNGHTVMLQVTQEPFPIVSGGPLNSDYRLSQLHFHWGENDSLGSENKINDRSYPMELHIVFFKKSYIDEKSALEHPDGLTVLSFLYELSPEINLDYVDLLKSIPQVSTVNSSINAPPILTLSMLMGKNRKKYYTYDGSLTTPPCSEVVQWIEFADRIELSHLQIAQFRNLYDGEGKMTHNFRPTQPLNDRQIQYYNEDSGAVNVLCHNIIYYLLFSSFICLYFTKLA